MSGYDGIDNALIIEFDTHSNPTLRDPYHPHLSIRVSASGIQSPLEPSIIPDQFIRIDDEHIHTVKMTLTPGIQWEWLESGKWVGTNKLK